jgi:CubicO group peptidase (beta-lactamase class C family)
MDRDSTKVWSPVEWLAIAFAHPPNAPPGTAYEYNNTNYLLLSLVAEKVDRKPLAQRRWLDSLQSEDPSKPKGQRYGYGIIQISWGPNTIYFHGGEIPGFNSFMGYDPDNRVTLVVWTNLTVSLDEQPTANTLMLKVLDQIYRGVPASTRLNSNKRSRNARRLSWFAAAPLTPVTDLGSTSSIVDRRLVAG